MNAHLNYFIHFLQHKWYFAREAFYLGLPLVTVIFHDMDKLLPDEWFPHVKAYANRGNGKYAYTDEFRKAMNLHRHRNGHHWQHWLMTDDNGILYVLEMPDHDFREMLADRFSLVLLCRLPLLS